MSCFPRLLELSLSSVTDSVLPVTINPKGCFNGFSLECSLLDRKITKDERDIEELFRYISYISVLKNVVELRKIKTISVLDPCNVNIGKLLEVITIFSNCSFQNCIKDVNHLLHVKQDIGIHLKRFELTFLFLR